MKEEMFDVSYTLPPDGGASVRATLEGALVTGAAFGKDRVDEARVLYIAATELVASRKKIGQTQADVRHALEVLFSLYRGEKVAADVIASANVPRPASVAQGFKANPGKTIDIDVDGITYERLPVKTRFIGASDTDILPLLEEYVRPHLQRGDLLFVSEKALAITQGRVVDMSDIHPSRLARFLARNVGNYYGSKDFHGFGHGTTLAMQLFIEEAGLPRVLFAAAVSAVTRPLGIRGLFYILCGKRAKSIDCPMSFLILEYAHSGKLAPQDPSAAAKRIRTKFGCETVVLDANYRGAFSLGKSTRAISESFIGKLFRDNPLGQSDEMTPFCIVRRK